MQKCPKALHRETTPRRRTENFEVHLTAMFGHCSNVPGESREPRAHQEPFPEPRVRCRPLDRCAQKATSSRARSGSGRLRRLGLLGGGEHDPGPSAARSRHRFDGCLVEPRLLGEAQRGRPLVRAHRQIVDVKMTCGQRVERKARGGGGEGRVQGLLGHFLKTRSSYPLSKTTCAPSGG